MVEARLLQAEKMAHAKTTRQQAACAHRKYTIGDGRELGHVGRTYSPHPGLWLLSPKPCIGLDLSQRSRRDNMYMPLF